MARTDTYVRDPRLQVLLDVLAAHRAVHGEEALLDPALAEVMLRLLGEVNADIVFPSPDEYRCRPAR
jgi:hypothetical protein